MPSKKEEGRARKAENENKKKEAVAATKERAEAAEWDKGAKSNKAKEDKEAKKAADAARKAEIARLLAEEEASMSTKKAGPKGGGGKKSGTGSKSKPAGPGAIAAGGLKSTKTKGGDAPAPSTSEVSGPPESEELVESFAATGIDDALDMLSVVNAKTDKASLGQDASKIEAHPERRFKAAFETYLESELPNARKEHPGLRLQQYRDLLFKQFQKHPDNPYNQTTIAFDATKEEKVAALKAERARVEERLREKQGQ